MSKFANKYGPWVLVTGASSGMGVEFARQLVQKGLNLVLVARRKNRLDRLASELSQQFGIETRVVVSGLSRDDFVGPIRPTQTAFWNVAGGKPQLALTPERVVKTALSKIGKRSTVVVGWINKLIVLSTRFTPRWINAVIFGHVVKLMRNQTHEANDGVVANHLTVATQSRVAKGIKHV